MSVKETLKIISITGAHSGVGKTTFCSILLKNLKGLGAIKFTKTPLYTSVIDDRTILSEEGKDTEQFLRAGAERVVWVRSPGGKELEGALEIALTKMTGLKGAIVEGNSPLDFLNPHLVVFIIGENGEIKPSALKAWEKADIVIINSGEQSIKSAYIASRSPKNIKVFRIDLINKEGEIDKCLVYIKKYTD